jgi:hypothetical protein
MAWNKTMIEWTAERIAQLETVEEVKSLRANAAKLGNQAVVERCDADLHRRSPLRVRQPRLEAEDQDRADQYVAEFHFVCPNESEVKKEPDGAIRTGTWVVAEKHAEAAIRYGSLVALHKAKAEPSYLQGRVTAFQKQPRAPKNADGELVSTESGIEFRLELTHDSLVWKGDGSGEKGYAWAPIPSSDSK